MTKKMIKVWAGIFMLLAGIFVGNMGGVQASITEDIAALTYMWKRIEKLPTQAEETISPVVVRPGEQASVLKTYTFGGEMSVFSAPIYLGSSPEVFLKVAVQGFSGNIIAHLGGQAFKRVKVGVGEKPKGYDLADYVLSRFSKAEREKVDVSLERAADAVVKILTDNMEAAMNEYNKKVEG